MMRDHEGGFMQLRRMLILVLMVVGVGAPQIARAGLSPITVDLPARSAPADYLEARQYKIADAQVAGTQGIPEHQTMTAWQVTHGSWQGQALDGLCLVLVQTTPDDSQGVVSTNCYVSYLATPAQRMALVNAFRASLGLGGQTAGDTAAWRIESAVIRLEFAGHRVILHLGVIA
jgi:hypothetical protein